MNKLILITFCFANSLLGVCSDLDKGYKYKHDNRYFKKYSDYREYVKFDKEIAKIRNQKSKYNRGVEDHGNRKIRYSYITYIGDKIDDSKSTLSYKDALEIYETRNSIPIVSYLFLKVEHKDVKVSFDPSKKKNEKKY